MKKCFWVFCMFPVLLLNGVCWVESSSGDRDPDFQLCVISCTKSCQSLQVTILSWGCKGDCEYDCMFQVTNKRIENGHNVLQYYGKWPFSRLFGVIQEPASFIFSLMNLVSQILGWLHYRKNIPSHYKFYIVNKAQFLINCLAWICAAVFHTRDTYWTEKMDYFSAALVIAISLFTCIVQITGELWCFTSLFSFISIIFLFGSHIGYMALINFDYGYNMKFLVANGVINIITWLVWSFIYRHQRPFAWKCAFAMGGTLLLATLEIWDFPPFFWIFDGHSLWHLGTTPISFIWFSFLTDNAIFEIHKKYYID